MNDRPTSGQYPDPGYDGLATTTFAGDVSYGSFETQGQGYDYSSYAAYDANATGSYDATAWATPAAQESYLTSIPAQSLPEDGTGQWDASAWSAHTDYQQPAAAFGYDTSGEQSGHWAMPGFGTTAAETGAYDATAWNSVVQEELPQQLQPEASYGYENESSYEYGAGGEYTSEYAAPAHAYESPAEYGAMAETAAFETAAFEATPTATFDAVPATAFDAAPTATFDAVQVVEDTEAESPDEAAAAVHAAETQTMSAADVAAASAAFEATAVSRAARRAAAKNAAAKNAAAKGAAARNATAQTGSATTGSGPGGGTGGTGRAASRRRTPAKRSALLTVAVPSVCVMGVAGVAAASVSGLTGGAEKTTEDTTTLAAPDPASVQPAAANSKLDTQLAALSADAGDFADRASRTQERIDLRVRQEEEKKKRAEEAAAKEAARPKFAVPVAQHGLSAGYGQSGGMWMSVHTGIDFPVGYGTPVMAATDGTVRTQWNSAYGNMVILTAPDGTETWYCHLSSSKIRSGKVKAGEVIAYSGNSGNSTGPHLHFEVRPGGGSPIDPSAWLRSKGLNPN
ncbi:M23 family metallopeptidase [Streptomyces sp. NPDC090022]|uniref:M23 family metallopeptidase n=1 Tax=Streptomyces sp. NPDC090022 TaxID=3365920 RepID=UPI003800552B